MRRPKQEGSITDDRCRWLVFGRQCPGRIIVTLGCWFGLVVCFLFQALIVQVTFHLMVWGFEPMAFAEGKWETPPGPNHQLEGS